MDNPSAFQYYQHQHQHHHHHHHPLPLSLPFPHPPQHQRHASGSTDSSTSPEEKGCRPPVPPKISSPERKTPKPKMNRPSLQPVIEGAQKFPRDLPTPPPIDGIRIKKSASRPELTRQRSAFFEEAFSANDVDLLGDLVRSKAIVMAEIKTNVIVHDEYTFINELSQHLAVRYHRQVSSIVVTVQHSGCIFFGGSCDPSYIMTIEALPSLVQAATNKRNVALLQQHMEQALGVPPSRGYCRFIPIAEECSGWKGKTVASQISDVSWQRTAQESQARRSTAPTKGSVGELLTPPLDNFQSPRGRPATADACVSDPAVLTLDTSGEYGLSPQISGGDASAKPKGLRRRKSFMHALFNRSVSRSRDVEVPRA
ncbi:Tautomerase/MIF superfamily [Mariannaea sp. PMI_226]|nr:Tautomerase/MIF superfamily [Mariannaea sp. PMI_226]